MRGKRKARNGSGRLYLKLRSGTWLLIKGRGSFAPVSSSRIFGLVGESIDGEPSIDLDKTDTLYISAFKITRYLLKILEEGLEAVVIASPVTRETYKVEVYGGSRKYVEKLRKIAEELKALKIPRKKVGLKP